MTNSINLKKRKNQLEAWQNLSLLNLPGEKWKDIPQLDGAYEISNFGRVKSKRRWIMRPNNMGFWLKEKIRKIQVQTQVVSDGKRKIQRLRIILRYDKFSYSIGIARMVYYLFIKEFDLEARSIFISCKDENPFHVHFSNLLFTSPSKTITKAYQKEHRPRDSFGNKARPIAQYDKTGKKIAEYPSIYEAAKLTGIGLSAINAQMSYSIGYTGGYIWIYIKKKPENIIISPAIKRRIDSEQIHRQIMITKYDLKGQKIKVYENLNAAAKAEKIQPNSIKLVLKGEVQTAGGFYWEKGDGKKQVSVEHIGSGRKTMYRAVTQYDLEGDRVVCFISITEAAKQTGIAKPIIDSALACGASATGAGYIWRYGKGAKKIKVHQRIVRKKYLEDLLKHPVTQYNLNGKRIKIYKNLRDAAKRIKGDLYQLLYAVTGKSLTYKKYLWQKGEGELLTATVVIKK